MNETLQITAGDTIRRNHRDMPNTSDIKFNLIRGATLQIVEVTEGICAEVKVIDNEDGYPSIDSRMSMPLRYFTCDYFSPILTPSEKMQRALASETLRCRMLSQALRLILSNPHCTPGMREMVEKTLAQYGRE